MVEGRRITTTAPVALLASPQHEGVVSQPTETKVEKRRPLPIVDSLKEIQAIQAHFTERAVPDDHPDKVVANIYDEMVELQEAIQSGDRKEISSELPDVFLNLCRLFNYYQIPMDIAISDKMARNAEKYNPAVLERMRVQGGLTSGEALGVAKGRWDRARDKDYCRVCGR